jgi:hypothetical protein
MIPLQVLVATTKPVSRTVVGAMLKKAGYPVIFAPMASRRGSSSTATIRRRSRCSTGKCLACRARSGQAHPRQQAQTPTYVILLTSRDSSADIVQGCAPAPTTT